MDFSSKTDYEGDDQGEAEGEKKASITDRGLLILLWLLDWESLGSGYLPCWR